MAPANAPAFFDHARRTFLHGYLDAAQKEAEVGYQRFIFSQPAWGRRFQLLQANAMAWRGLNEQLLTSLADDRIPWVDVDDKVQRLALEVGSLTRLHRLPEAGEKLQEAQKLCGATRSGQCGTVLLSEGLYELEQGKSSQAQESFLRSMEFGRASHDRMLEASALLNLGHIASEEEHHDEALEYYRRSATAAAKLGANDLLQRALFSEGYEQYALGNSEKALEMYVAAEDRAKSLGDLGLRSLILAGTALAYADSGQSTLAERSDLRAIELARKIGRKQTEIDASMDLGRLYIRLNKPNAADIYLNQASSMSAATGSSVDLLTCSLLRGEAASLRRDYPRSLQLFEEVASSPDSQPSMRWQAEHGLGRMYETQGDMVSAQHSYEAALGLVEGARADLNQEISQLTFLENASSIYDDYIHLLVSEGKTQEALEAADWSRARTLQQGLGSLSKQDARQPSGTFTAAPKLKEVEIARKANASLLFYWLGERQSYLWVITPERTQWVALPPRSELLPSIERYKLAILSLKDPLKADTGEAAKDASSLYRDLVTPAAGQLRQDRPVVLFVDGEMGQLNFESLVVPSPSPHFWIEDATVLSAPSIRMFAESVRTSPAAGKNEPKMLLFGDATPSGTEFRALPMAALEMEKVESYFPGNAKIFQGAQATPAAYLASSPEKFQYIHFVTHGTASRTDPLESAVILSPGGAGEDTYRLYARDILQHPIDAQLVTISACNSSGSKSFAGEGMVGLSWAFLRAGAHNAIGSLWEVSDASTPELMSTMYQELGRGQAPAAALRSAKLSLIHSGGHFNRPFYWAPFQLYAGR
ncbi:CHAT domain-containing protein [Granulicella aggregans]|uniref:CHAT domain-containing protein n=1 Tax=Granulicella aggregans TaxID=474949 RepID=A0A7W8E5X3_9BACT|nr:CHAT domain-containing protein [Granulicella aggregans]